MLATATRIAVISPRRLTFPGLISALVMAAAWLLTQTHVSPALPRSVLVDAASLAKPAHRHAVQVTQASGRPWHHPRITVAAAVTSITVRPGDSLSALAKRLDGSAGAWPALWWANRHKIASPSALMAGMKLAVPASWAVTPAMAHAALAAAAPPAPPPASHVGSGSGSSNSQPIAVAAPVVSGVLSPAQVGALWLAAGGPGWAETAAEAVAYCESGDSTTAQNGSGATGLWQILGQVVPGNLFDGLVNAENAVAKFKASGDTWSQWVCQP
jgi:LysM domain